MPNEMDKHYLMNSQELYDFDNNNSQKQNTEQSNINSYMKTEPIEEGLSLLKGGRT